MCKLIAEYQARLSAVPVEHRKFFDAVLENYLVVAEDNDVNKAILDGSWPDALTSIQNAAAKLGYKLVPIDS